MAQQLNLLATDKIIPTPLHMEMQRSYLEYAMSVIVGRALPDVRDGLKPVHRRILYAMHELGLTPDRPYRKCARVVGDVLGKYHPHGDQAVYDALVRMVQEFSTRYPLLAGHGNFGSIDNDPPAAMRYTETRLAAISHEALLGEISEATVEFTSNFDNSQQEPAVLPAQLPILLLNGSSGIAVGMATNIPPHNLGEIVDGLIALIDRPDLSDKKLWELIPGPDFPTGGEIISVEGIKDAYSTGRGSITLRGISHIENADSQPSTRNPKSKRSRHRRTAIVITELPYQVNKASWIEKIADLVNHGKIEGIADVRDESDREGMRVVIELKRDTNPKVLLEQLYKQTALQNNFGAILLALVDGQPRQLTLRQLLEEFLIFREQTLTRQYSEELQQAETRIHLVEGLLNVLNQLDDAIALLRNSPDGSTAKQRFQSELNFSEAQADAILAMPMRRLTGLEQENLQAEFDQLSSRIQGLRGLLSDRHELLKALKKDLRSLKRRYSDERRTKISVRTTVETQATNTVKAQKQDKRQSSKPASKAESSTTRSKKRQTPESEDTSTQLVIPNTDLPEEEVVLQFTQRGYIRRVSKSASDREQKPKSQDDLVIHAQVAQTQDQFLVITQSGKAYPLKVRDIPSSGSSSKGTLFASLIPSASQDALKPVVTQLFLPDTPATSSLVLVTQRGQIKRLQVSELEGITNRGLTLIKLKENDELEFGCLTQNSEEVILATSGGRLLRFQLNEAQLPIMGRSSQGFQALRLGRGENLVSALTVDRGDTLLVISQQGYGKRLPVNSLRLANRGDIGTQALQFTTKTDALAGTILTSSVSEVALLTSLERVLRVGVESVAFWGKDGTGDRIIQLKPDEKIVSVTGIGRM